jgi:hypothetical protein
MKTLHDMVKEINAAAVDYAMRDFQEIRRKIHGLSHTKTAEIFTSQTTQDDRAFHSGGRKEIQFNIGFEGNENDWLRFGLAFSLEPSQALPDPLILKPKVLKLNEYIQENQSELEDTRFWYYFEDQRSPTLPVTPVSEHLIRVGTFLFWGKMAERDIVQPQEVLFLFDRFLPIYEFVEGNVILKKRPAELHKGFQFSPGCSVKAEVAIQRSQAATKAITLRHNKLQETLHSILTQKYGKDNVGTENDTGRGSRVDLVVRNGNGHTYYEIKTSPDVRECLREGIAQLFEYSYWPGGSEAEALVVVSDNPFTADARRYLVTLRERFHLPIFYQYLDLTNESLGSVE